MQAPTPNLLQTPTCWYWTTAVGGCGGHGPATAHPEGGVWLMGGDIMLFCVGLMVYAWLMVGGYVRVDAAHQCVRG